MTSWKVSLLWETSMSPKPLLFKFGSASETSSTTSRGNTAGPAPKLCMRPWLATCAWVGRRSFRPSDKNRVHFGKAGRGECASYRPRDAPRCQALSHLRSGRRLGAVRLRDRDSPPKEIFGSGKRGDTWIGSARRGVHNHAAYGQRPEILLAARGLLMD